MENRKTIRFETETVHLLNMMIHSVYTNKEVFLRELISNASDAIDRRYMTAMAHPEKKLGPLKREAYAIRLTLNKKERLLAVSDNGIGMDEEDLRTCLGTVAFSGSGVFRAAQSGKEAAELIGQFGIGFYSLFMAADHVRVVTRKAGTEQAYVFESDGLESYTVGPGTRADVGTDVILHIREDDGNDTYDRYLREYPLYKLVRKYSDYIRWPILLYMPVPIPDKDGNPQEKWGWQLLNSMVPLWRRKQSDVTAEEYNAFYREQFLSPRDLEAENSSVLKTPLAVVPVVMEGRTEFRALLYIPSCAWAAYDTKE